jgi:hypothetical protein
MGKVGVYGFSDKEEELIEKRADEAGMTKSGFVLTRFRAGWRLWDAGGDFDVLEMQKRLDEEGETQQASDPTEPASAAGQDRFVQQIKRNLPTAEDDAVPIDELKKTVSEEVVADVLDELRDSGEVKYVTGKGYIRVR